MRPTIFLAPILFLTLTLVANAQQPDTAAVLEHVLKSGDGQTPGTAYAVPGLLWEYPLLGRLDLRFVKQRTAKDTGTDIVTARDPKTGQVKDIWFRAATSDAPDQAETDRAVRAIMTSGDGMTPETAFVVGGRIGAEYQILRFMGIKPNMQGLVTIRGCSFDYLSGRDLDTGEPRKIYFKLGSPGFDDRGTCVLQPARKPH